MKKKNLKKINENKKKREKKKVKQYKKNNYGFIFLYIVFISIWTITIIITIYQSYNTIILPLEFNNAPSELKENFKSTHVQIWSTGLGLLLYTRIILVIRLIFKTTKAFIYNTLTYKGYLPWVLKNIKFQIKKFVKGIKFGYLMFNNFWWFFLTLSLIISWGGIFATKNQIEINPWITLLYHATSGALPCFSLISAGLGCYFLKDKTICKWALTQFNDYKLSKFEIFFLTMHTICGILLGYLIFSKIISFLYFITWNYSILNLLH